MPELGRDLPRVLSPLWVISLFLGLSETTVTIAITQAQGWVQSLLSVFAVVFPMFVATAFFYILWNNNKVFYAPGEFAAGTTVTEYAEAMTRHARRGVRVAEDTLLNKVAAELEQLNFPEEQLKKILEAARNAADQMAITVDTATFAATPEDRVAKVPVAPSTTVEELTDTVYFALSKRVPPYTYGKVWLLRDESHVYNKIGTTYAWDKLQALRDTRRLADVGIKPGTKLTVVPVHGKGPSPVRPSPERTAADPESDVHGPDEM